ncbi:hypothetical protein O6H91_19G019700 [Diphasiastrum complanatum]|uniref:Uncharacterized protein n=2 Tax=Diphasiastrum complanatum TaxID=34168 RepID=A0ACC2ATF3_DIPCM|nr:hypothetical protein O6H91_19G019700 [Diphasiastrum complanatum]KAJ7520726.1 hypothetical protein O6H91_19G019700 [Diphasiastrum complanatum]
MDALFSKGFKASKCKTLIKLAMARIKLLRNKRNMQVKQMRREIANLLQNGQEPSARIRVEHIVREQNIMAAYEILELFCELIVVRLPIIESQRQCPLDLKESIASVIFAAPRCADLPELLEVRGLFGVKYGKEFMAAAAELRPACGVNRKIIEKLSVRAPSGETKLKLLKEIAAEHNVEWDPSDSESELLKPAEDLLDGPSQFMASRVSLPASAKEETYTQEEQTSVKAEGDFMEVTPKPATVPVQSATGLSPALKPSFNLPHYNDEAKQFVPFVLTVPGQLPFAGRRDSPPKPAPILPNISPDEDFSRSVHQGNILSPSVESSIDDPYSRARSTVKMDYNTTTTQTQIPRNNQGRSAASPVDRERDVSSRSNKGVQGEYSDIASAAQAAAESAELAAAAARSAASLAKGDEPSKSGVVEKVVNPTSDSSSDAEDDDYIVNPYSLSNEKSGGYDNDIKSSMLKDNVSAATKPLFDDNDDYDGPDVLEAKVLRKTRAGRQKSLGGWSSNKSSELFNEAPRSQSHTIKFPSQPDLPAQYDDTFDFHSEKEQVPEESTTEEPKLNLSFFSGKRGIHSLDDADETPDYGPTEFQSKGKSFPVDYRRTTKTKPPSNLEDVGDEEKNIVGESSPYMSSNVAFHSKHSGSSTFVTSSQADHPSYDSPSGLLPSHFDDSPADIKTFTGLSGDSQGSFSSTVSQPPRRPPPEVPQSSEQDSLPRQESGGGLSSRSSSGTISIHPKLPDYDDLAARFSAMKSSRS